MLLDLVCRREGRQEESAEREVFHDMVWMYGQ